MEMPVQARPKSCNIYWSFIFRCDHLMLPRTLRLSVSDKIRNRIHPSGLVAVQILMSIDLRMKAGARPSEVRIRCRLMARTYGGPLGKELPNGIFPRGDRRP